ncbi:nmrA-family protein [Trametes cingulata]|nr:nmrA-family protein [Trametes cingulata]
MSPTASKIIVVIGATGAQGLAVIEALLKPAPDGSPSPYAVRAFTRDPQSKRGQELAARGVEVVKGTTYDLDSVLEAFKGAYGAYVNTDSFTLGEEKEIFTGMRLYEIAKQVKTLKHYVWSSLDNVTKKSDYNPIYYAEHYAGKSRVTDWMKAQESVVSDGNMSWSVLTTGPYMDMLKMVGTSRNETDFFGPIKVRPDGTHVFVSPVAKGHIPMIALSDVGFFARYIFDHREEASAQELEVASDLVGWDYLVETFTKVTGKKAVYVPLSLEEYFGLLNQDDVNKQVASGAPPGSTTFKENFMRWWRLYRDDILTRDFDWIRRIHPDLHTLESWMREEGYTGEVRADLLKEYEDGQRRRPNVERIAQL